MRPDPVIWHGRRLAIRLERAEARRLMAVATAGPAPGETGEAYASRLEDGLLVADRLGAAATTARQARTAARAAAALGGRLAIVRKWATAREMSRRTRP